MSAPGNGILRLVLPCLIGATAAIADEIPSAEGQALFLEKYCLDCHREGKAKGGLRVDEIDPFDVRYEQLNYWNDIFISVRTFDMPPEDDAQPSDEELKEALAWYAYQIKANTPFIHRYLHQLDIEEYANTLRDLLGLAVERPDARERGGERFRLDTQFLIPGEVPGELLGAYSEVALGVLGEAKMGEMAERLGPEAKGFPDDDRARAIFRNLLPRAYGRPVSEEEIMIYADYLVRQTEAGIDFDAALRSSLMMLVLSPKFTQMSDGSEMSREYLLASKLSYFFWKTLPGDELRERAETGQLAEARAIDKVVREALSDEEVARAFSEAFVRRWYVNRAMGAGVDGESVFRSSSPQDQQAMIDEAAAFFLRCLRENRSVTALVGAGKGGGGILSQAVVRAQVLETAAAADGAEGDAWLLEKIFRETFDIRRRHLVGREHDVASLREMLGEHPERLARSLINRFLVYGNCLPLQLNDKEAVDGIMARVRPGGFGLRDLLVATLASELFVGREAEE